MKKDPFRLEQFLDARRAVALVWRSARGWTVGSAVLLLAQGLLPLATLYLMKLIVDAVLQAARSPGGDFPGRVVVYIGAAASVGVVGILCTSLSRWMTEAQSQTVADHIYDVLHAKSIEADLAYYESPQYYDTLHLAQQEAPYRSLSIVNSLVQFGRSAICLAAISGLLVAFHWVVALILLAAAVPGFLVRLRFARTLFAWRRRRASTERETAYFNALLTDGAYAKEIRLFDLGRVFTQRFSAFRQALRGEHVRMIAARSGKEFVTQSCATVAVFACLLLIAHRTVRGDISLGYMVMLFMAFQRGHASLRDMLGSLAVIYENNLFISNFYAFLDLEPQVQEPARPADVPTPLRSGIRFETVSFRYPGGTRPVVRDVSFEVRPGEHVALVGENGAGKTTLVKLLCRLYDPDAGRITVDGIDLRELGTTRWRKHISVIFQDFARYHLSARENIWLGNVDLPADSPRVQEAAERSGADAVIRRLPHGYDTRLGRRFEEGEELSIGQWQEVALARAFLRDAQLIILDEPTSALDARAEAELFQRFHDLAAGRTTITISHRMSTVRMADRILVLGESGISESGTHDELMARPGRYAQLFEMQAQNYR